MRRIPDILRKKILAMWLAGDSYRAIQQACLVALATINTVKEEAKKRNAGLGRSEKAQRFAEEI